MTWTPFSSEAILLDSRVRALHKLGRVTEAIIALEEALENAHKNGPSNMTYEQFEAAAEQD